MHYSQDPNRLEIYFETQKRRILAGVLEYIVNKKRYVFTYDLGYLHYKSAISVGPEFPMTKIEFKSKKNVLFSTFQDRIPPKENPAYEEYCLSQGVSPEEENLIILLTTIGRRGPSALIYEPIFIKKGSLAEDLKAFRKQCGLTRWDVAMIFEVPELTVYKIESGKILDASVSRLIFHYLSYPNVALDQLQRMGKKVHRHTRTRVYRYFKSLSSSDSTR